MSFLDELKLNARMLIAFLRRSQESRRGEVSTDFRGLIEALSREEVDFIIVGGIAGILHGAARATYDLDVVYSRSTDNQERLVHPRSNLTFAGLPHYRFDSIKRPSKTPLTTTAGDLDLLGEIPGGGRYEALLPEDRSSILRSRLPRLKLGRLIEVKRARDLDAIAELELIPNESKAS